MPSHPDRVRSAPLPQGFQFGDGAKCEIAMRYLTPHGWRAWHLNAAERLTRQSIQWNVIEGEHNEVEGVPGSYLSRWRIPLRLELADRLAPFSTDRDPGDEA